MQQRTSSYGPLLLRAPIQLSRVTSFSAKPSVLMIILTNVIRTVYGRRFGGSQCSQRLETFSGVQLKIPSQQKRISNGEESSHLIAVISVVTPRRIPCMRYGHAPLCLKCGHMIKVGGAALLGLFRASGNWLSALLMMAWIWLTLLLLRGWCGIGGML